MASTSNKQNDSQAPKPGHSDAGSKGPGHGLNHPPPNKLETFPGVSEENDRNSNLSPSKSTDPARKKTFKITSVKKGGTGSGDVVGDTDADSIDGLDESQTEDFSSEFYDSSKATDLDMDLQECMNIPLTPDELTSTTTIVVKQKPDQNSQSRFKVVKIETKEPFRRGKWVCYDFFDTTPASVVTVEKNGSKLTEDSIIQSALAGNLSSSSSVHFVQDVNDSSSNIFIPPVVPMSPPRTDGQRMMSDVFVPIQPAPASHVLSQLDGLTSDAMAPFIAQQVLMSVASVPSSSTSFHNLAQPGHSSLIQAQSGHVGLIQPQPGHNSLIQAQPGHAGLIQAQPGHASLIQGAPGHAAMIQNLPPGGLFTFPQNSSPVGLFQNGVAGQGSQMIGLPTEGVLAVGGSGAPPVLLPAATVAEDSLLHGQVVGSVPVPHSQSQTHLGADAFVPQGVHLPQADVSSARPATTPATIVHVPQGRTEGAVGGVDIGEQMGPGMDESTSSIKTLQGDPDYQPSEGMKEAVQAVGEMYMALDGADDGVDESGGSSVAIDNKIEQAMDLVKRHLMYAVREEVEILKQQIGEMSERINQLEYENNVLRSEAKPETLSKLMQSRIPSTSQPTGQSQSTHQPPQAASQPQSAPQQLAPAPSAVVPSQLPAPQPQGVSGQPGLPPSTT